MPYTAAPLGSKIIYNVSVKKASGLRNTVRSQDIIFVQYSFCAKAVISTFISMTDQNKCSRGLILSLCRRHRFGTSNRNTFRIVRMNYHIVL